MAKNLYDTLNLKKSASDAEIKSQYRKLARKYHPDLNKDDKTASEKFKEISSAYEILGDKDKRGKYDNNEIDAEGKQTGFGATGGFNGFGGGKQGGFNGFGGGQSYSGFNAGGFDFSSLFDYDDNDLGMFANGGRRNTKGKDEAFSLDVDFLDAVKGAEKNIIMNNRQLNIKIPAGTNSGQVLRLKGQGAKSPYNGASGDALITINVGEHKYFKSEGANILLDLPISFKESILGAKIIIPTITGKVYLNIPPYSSSGDKLRLNGKGIKLKNKLGDQIINILIVAPKNKDVNLENILINSVDENIREF